MMNNKKILALYGLKYNPFLSDIPVDELWTPPQVDSFFFRAEHLVQNGGFALICGEPGLGKSKILHLLSFRLDRLSDVAVGVMERPQSSLSDFYRELGILFGVNLSVANRYGGFRALRERWKNHIKNTLFRPVLLIDECQEMHSCCLNELRLLSSARFDSECLLSAIMCGDLRLPERFRDKALLSLGTRIRLRMNLVAYTRDDLLAFLEHIIEQAGAPHLMTPGLKETLVDHAAGNLRLLTTMAAELLEEAARKELSLLDEKLFLQVYNRQPSAKTRPPHRVSSARP